MGFINIKDIARLCGVGVSTVSRAINNHPDINPETKNMIMQVIKENNYIPNNSARNLKRTDSRAIAVLIKGIGNPFFSKMIRVFEEEIQKKKYSFILQRVDEQEDEVDVALELIKEKKPRGIVFLGGYFSHSKEELEQLTVPYVLSTIGIAEYLGKSPDFSCVSV
ncbi:MAG: LacI family DNA-binding transcriptional regulator, partial [Lacrimispora sphenoides]